MQQYLDELTEWTHENDMVINSGKTKEMIMGRIDVSDLPPICTTASQIERVHSFKLFGVYVVQSLSWSCHIKYITAEASKRQTFILFESIKTCWITQQLLEAFLYFSYPSNTGILFGCLWA